MEQIDCGLEGGGIGLLKEQHHYSVSWGGKGREVHEIGRASRLGLGSLCLTYRQVREGDKFITFQILYLNTHI